MRCIRNTARFLHCWVALAAVAAGGCHLEQGKLYFDEIGLDPITVYSMAPLEKTVFCLVEAKDKQVQNFDYMYNMAVQEVAGNPASADWSELVCLSLADEAKPEQLRQTVEVLDRVEAAQPQRSHPVTGFRNLLEQRLALHAEIAKNQQRLEEMEQDMVKNSVLYEANVANQRRLAEEQRKKIGLLEQQVRELKEIELLLHPKQ